MALHDEADVQQEVPDVVHGRPPGHPGRPAEPVKVDAHLQVVGASEPGVAAGPGEEGFAVLLADEARHDVAQRGRVDIHQDRDALEAGVEGFPGHGLLAVALRVRGKAGVRGVRE